MLANDKVDVCTEVKQWPEIHHFFIVVIEPRKHSPVFTGRAGPSVPEDDHISSYPGESFWDEVNRLGGLPKDVFEHKELLEFFEPFLRSDFKAVETYRYNPMPGPLRIPIHLVIGNQEKDVDL